jgi:hypothetical protein
MKVETMGRVLIAIGALVMLYAQLAMPTALPGADIVNIGLMSERQNTLILGGLFFLAGIVLFAVFKMKQTKEDTEIEEAQQRERIAKAKDAIQATSVEASQAAKSAVEKLNQGALSASIRVGTGILAGLFVGAGAFNLVSEVVWLYTDNFIEGYAEMPVILAAIGLATAYAFRKIPTLKVVAHLVGGAAVIFVAASVAGSFIHTAKITECEQATFRTKKCSEILYP